MQHFGEPALGKSDSMNGGSSPGVVSE